MSDFAALSIVIPTHFRHGYLRRILDFYAQSGIRILVADSTDTPFDGLERYNTVQYYHYPGIGLAAKTADILQKVETPYTLLCADDDFILLPAIAECLNFLTANPDYASAQGHYVQFRNSGGRVSYQPMYLHSIGRDINADTAGERIKQQFAKNMQVYYSVKRTEAYQDVYSTAVETGLNNVNFFPKLDSMLTVIHGKHKVLPVFYSAREFIPGSGSATTLKFTEVLRHPDFQAGVQNFLSVASKRIALKDGIALSRADQYVREAFDLLCAWINRRAPLAAKSAFGRSMLFPVYKKLKLKLYRYRQRSSGKSAMQSPGFPHYDANTRKQLARVEQFIRDYPI